MDLLSYFRILRRRWWVILLCVVIGAGLGALSTELSSGSSATGKARTYNKATVTLVLSNSSGSNSGTFASAYSNLDQLATLTTTGPVPDAVAKSIGEGQSGPQLAEHITTLTNQASGTLQITAVDPDGDPAVALANGFADQLLTNVRDSDLARYNQANKDANDRLTGLQKKIDDISSQLAGQPTNDVLQAQLRAVSNQYTSAYDDFESIASKQPPTNPLTTLQKAQAVPISAGEYQTRLTAGQLGQNNLQAGSQTVTAGVAGSSGSFEGRTSRAILGGLLGLILGIGIAVLMERLDRKIRTRVDAEHAFELPVLAEVPELTTRQRNLHEIVAATKPLSAAAEAYRAVRSSLLFQQATAALTASDADAPAEGAPMVVMISSAAPNEGKTTSSANLAAVFGAAGASVLVLNCDFRRPTVHEYFGVSDAARKVHRTQIPGVKVVSNVTNEADPNPAKVIAMQRQLIAAARDQFDVVILDTAPLLSANDALDMVADCDFVVIIARAGISKEPAAIRAVEMLDRVHAPLVGVVLVGIEASASEYYGYGRKRGDASKGGRGDSASAKSGSADAFVESL
jgi:Mrp family chromosome partitioning ATPase/capsular polysaccharide biosynthesis protein